MMEENMGGDIPALAAALAKAQGEISPAEKDRENPHFRSHYATLASIREAVREPLAKNGLSVVQMPSTDGNLVSVRTLLLHTGGGWLMSECASLAKDQSPQPVGSVITYLRRYGLAAMLGVVADEDDDAEAGQSSAPTHQRPEARRNTAPDIGHAQRTGTGNGSGMTLPATAAQRSLIERISKSHAVADWRGEIAEIMAGEPTRKEASDLIERINNAIRDSEGAMV